MATAPSGIAPARGVRAALARFLTLRGAATVPEQPAQLPRADNDEWGSWTADPIPLQFLAGSGNRQVRSRQQVYTKWQDMVADPIISAALRLHVTAALGGHESRGEMIFIEAAPWVKEAAAAVAKAKKDSKKPPKPGAKPAKDEPPKLSEDEQFVADLAADLQPLFNKIAVTMGFNATAFGDAYARIYAERGVGVRDLYVDELVYPPLVQPFERGNTTIGYQVATGTKFFERLTVMQLARLKLPRTMYVPQDRTIEKAIRTTLQTDKIEDLPAVPSTAGGSFLDGAEVAYDKFSAAWTGLVGQRVQDSIDESILTVQMDGMTAGHRKSFVEAIKAMYERSAAYVAQVVEAGRYVVKKIVHIVPVSKDKQLTQVAGPATPGRTSSLTIEDVMMHARFLAGSLGMDLSMIGFADQLSGGLGDGGFFRVSAQSAERSRLLRMAMSECLNHIVEVHALLKHGRDFHGQPKPWVITYYSDIGAAATEQAQTRATKSNNAAMMVQTMAQLRELGMDEATMAHFLETEGGLDADAAAMYAKAIANAPKPDDGMGGGGGGMGGGFGGPPDGGEDLDNAAEGGPGDQP